MEKENRRRIRVYPNRRLYDPVVSGYITYDNVLDLVRDGHDVLIEDASTGTDLTRSVLVDLVVRQEQGYSNQQRPLLTKDALMELIRLSGQPCLLPFLEHCMAALQENDAKVTASPDGSRRIEAQESV